MSEDTYHALIVKHYPRSISATAELIGGKAGRNVYITSEYTLMDLLSIIPYVSVPDISKGSGINTSASVLVEVV